VVVVVAVVVVEVGLLVVVLSVAETSEKRYNRHFSRLIDQLRYVKKL
jgi:hypothetical protein